MATGIEPSLEQVSAMSGEFERMFGDDTPRTCAAACVAAGGAEDSRQEVLEIL